MGSRVYLYCALYLGYLYCTFGVLSEDLNPVWYSTKAKVFVRCPFYTKSAHLDHPLLLRNVYENQRKFVLELANMYITWRKLQNP